MLTFFFSKINQLPSWLWVMLTGVATGLGCRAGSFGFLWLFALFPLFIVFDRIVNHLQLSWKQKLGRVWLACWGVGCLCAALAVPFMVHSIHVFGHLPQIVGIFITVFIYGLELTFAFFSLFGVPLLIIKRWNGWDLPVRIAFFLVLEPLYPKFFPWSVGKFAFSEAPWIAQSADVIGSSGLGFFALGSNCLLLLLWRHTIKPGASSKSWTRRFALVYLVLLCFGIGYGGWRTIQLQRGLQQGEPVHIAALQPNFSLERLASNPDLAYSKRQKNIHALLEDSEKALARFPQDTPIPKLIVWPESVYPFAYLKDTTGKAIVEQFAQQHQTAVLLASIDWERTEEGDPKFYGISLLIGEDGKLRGRYNKIYLIPFGEFIPGAELFPAYRQWLRDLIPNISEFAPGNEFTVFQLSDKVRFSGAICYDAFSSQIMRQMGQNGAELIVILSNLAWFGKTNASQHMKLIIRWHAIENRLPFLFISNNGETVFFNLLGGDMSETLGLFEQGSLSETILLNQHFSFYREYYEWLLIGWACLLAVMLVLGHRQGQIFTKPETVHNSNIERI